MSGGEPPATTAPRLACRARSRGGWRRVSDAGAHLSIKPLGDGERHLPGAIDDVGPRHAGSRQCRRLESGSRPSAFQHRRTTIEEIAERNDPVGRWRGRIGTAVRSSFYSTCSRWAEVCGGQRFSSRHSHRHAISTCSRISDARRQADDRVHISTPRFIGHGVHHHARRLCISQFLRSRPPNKGILLTKTA